MDQTAAIEAAAQRVRAAGLSPPRPARDPVNLPMIRNWTEAIGDANPVYTDWAFAGASAHRGLVAPPAMVQVWTMRGLHPVPDPDDPLGLMSAELDEAGFTSVVATNCDQVYHRYLRHGEQLTIRAELLDVTGPKRTALGEGWFVTTRSTWFSAEEPVATMDFRVLKFRPPEPAGAGTDARDPANASSPPAPPTPVQVMRPPVSPDTAFFWAGTAAGELRIQECGECGALRHPPGPVCRQCGADKPGYRVAAGTGEVFSYVVHRHPPVPGKELPIVIALVQLTEGVRMLGELHGIEPEQVSIGLPVQVQFTRIDDELTLPGWRPAGPASQQPASLPEFRLHVTPTVVVSTALATRDFQDVHHDRDLAVMRGSKDIFLNILSTTGLVQRYVTDWAGPETVVKAISIRLGAPCYAGDTLTFSGQLTDAPPGEQVISVTGTCSLGKHVTATVTLSRGGPGGSSPQGHTAEGKPA